MSSSAPEAADPATQPAAMADPSEERYAATHVLIGFAGAARSNRTRTDAEAHERAMDVYRRLVAGEDIEELARRYSDGPSAPRGGAVGVYRPSTMMPEFERAIAAVEVGQFTRPFKSAFGWHVARRDAVIEVHARHVLVTWKGASRSNASRTRGAARAIIEQARQRIEAGERFEQVAKELGDDAAARRGGDLGVLAQGQLIPAFEAVVFGLEPGQRSDIVETPYGFHIIERLR